MLRAYVANAVNAKDVALQLPTGSGKTLVGLLIGEWFRRKNQERVVYLCPTVQLVNQVVEQAKQKYGIKSIAFTGSKYQYSPASKAEYSNAEALAVTTYSSLFNVNPFFDNAHVIILDDAHAAENYIIGHWSLLIDQSTVGHATLFTALATSLKSVISALDYHHLCNDPDKSPDPQFGSEPQWVEKLPTPIFYEHAAEIAAIIDAHVDQDSDLRYQWGTIRDHLYACHMYLAPRQILIRPLIPPTRTHIPFAGARQRLYMSATLGEAGELERLTGTNKLVRLPVPTGWDKQGIGRRLFFFPERSLEESKALELAFEMMTQTPRSLVLTPSEREANKIRGLISSQLGYQLFNASQIEESKAPFIQTPKAVAVVANRYDGIDLVGDECRLLILKGLPRATNLQEQFLISRCGSALVYTDRILTRFVQAAGRCTRSATDYAAVVILGEALNKFLMQPDKRVHLHPEIQAELGFGIDESKDLSKEDFMENLRTFFAHKADWDEADAEIVARREEMQQKPLPGTDELGKSVPHEVQYQYLLWKSDYEGAVAECRQALQHLSGDDLKGYRAFWYYLAGSAAWLAHQAGIQPMASIARDFFTRAASISTIRWLTGLSRIGLTAASEEHTDQKLMRVVERLEGRLEELGTANDLKFEAEIKSILSGLADADSAKVFEEAQVKLGELLGYQAGNNESTAAPDPWWIVDDDLCIVFEDHTGLKEGNRTIGVNKVRQAASHPNWIRKNMPVSQRAHIVPVLVTPCSIVDDHALPHADNLSYWNLDEFREWAENAISVVRKLRRSFPGSGDLAWRADAITAYKDAALDPASIIQMLESTRVTDLQKASSVKAASEEETLRQVEPSNCEAE